MNNDEITYSSTPRKKASKGSIRRGPAAELTAKPPDQMTTLWCDTCNAEVACWLSRYPGRPAVCTVCRSKVHEPDDLVVTHVRPRRGHPERLEDDDA
jgi:hypothetical protein